MFHFELLSAEMLFPTILSIATLNFVGQTIYYQMISTEIYINIRLLEYFYLQLL